MKRSEYNVLVRSTATFVLFRSKTFMPAIMTQPTEEEIAEGVVPTQIYSPYWSVDCVIDGPQGTRTGAEAAESTEEATDADLLQVIKVKYAPAESDWRFMPDEIEEDEPVHIVVVVDPNEEAIGE